METVTNCVDANTPMSIGDGIYEATQTFAEYTLSLQARALGTLTNLPSDFWARRTLPPNGIVRDFIELGRVKPGDKLSRAGARDVLKKSSSLAARLHALYMLSWQPTEEDIEAVRWVAENDQTRAKALYEYFKMPGADQTLCSKPASQRQIYVMRVLAQRQLQEMHR